MRRAAAELKGSEGRRGFKDKGFCKGFKVMVGLITGFVGMGLEMSVRLWLKDDKVVFGSLNRGFGVCLGVGVRCLVGMKDGNERVMEVKVGVMGIMEMSSCWF